MKLDLYTLYIYKYSKEYLFEKNIDIIKIRQFSNCFKVDFYDNFIFEKKIASDILEFYEYLRRRKCFKVGMLVRNKECLILKFWCNFSLEYWYGTKEEVNGKCIMKFEKVHEELWAKKYLNISEEEEKDLRLRFKQNNYTNI